MVEHARVSPDLTYKILIDYHNMTTSQFMQSLYKYDYYTKFDY